MAYRLVVGLRRWIAAARAKFAAKLVALPLSRGVPSPWSISTRLTIAFAGVAILAAAANFIVEQGVSIATREPIAPPLALPTPRIDITAPTRVIPATTYETISADELTRALERFDQSVYAAVESGSVEIQARYHQAGQGLDRATKNLLSRTARLSDRSLSSLSSPMQEHKRAAARWIDLSSARRKLLLDYSQTLERMNTRVNASLERAFKIFGRIVAHQSLMQVHMNLEQVREHFTVAMRAGSSTAESFDGMEHAQAAFAGTLRKYAKRLKNTEGNEWYIAMEQDLTVLTELHDALEMSHPELVSTANAFVDQANLLLGLLPKDFQVAVPIPETAPHRNSQRNRDASPSVAPRPPSLAPAIQETITARASNAATAIVPSGHIVTQTQIRAERRAVVAWISVVVLIVLSLISFATVRSVVKPVEDLIDASRKIAAGEPDTRVRRGGIKELDTLAVAFNDMADRLRQAHARALEAHHQLEEKVAERTRQLQMLAEVDPLTNLPNRRHLFTLLNASIEQAAQQRRRIGVLFLDVDNFKNINDSVGHTFGDRVLRGIAERLEIATRSVGFAARLGGDEFTVVCDQAENVDDIHALGERIIRAFQSPIDIDGRELIVGVSVGASIYPDHERTAEALLIAADTALFNAKALGRSRVSMFTPELLTGASTKFRIEQDLRRAIEREEFELFYQPELGIESLQTNLVEALIRWRKPDGSYVPPGEFLGVAEESGLIIEISDWVLRTAIKAAAQWHRGAWPQARVAINVSPRHLLDYRFVDRVQQLLTQHDVPPRCIEIELTESVLQTGPATIEQLHRLRALGLAIALDDFGTGYSSLSSLEQLPLTRVKLDRSLIECVDSNERSQSIVRAIIDLCNGLGLQVTAEGLERSEQFERFLGHRNLSLQGHLLSRPVPMEQLFKAMEHAAQRAQELVLLSKPKIAPGALPKMQTERVEYAASV